MSVPAATTLSRLEKLVAFATVSRDSNLGVIEWVRDELAAQGVASRLTYDNDRRKANLFATIGDGGTHGGIVLSGHTDVVPVDGQDWKTDPFKATLLNERVHGRGAADMKGFIAVVLAAVPEMLVRKGGKPLHIALSYDEEVGCLGVPRLLEDLSNSGIRPAGCVVGEPTGMSLVIGHKGASVHTCNVHGRAANSSLAAHGVNAISYAAAVIAQLRQLSKRLWETEAPHSGYDVEHTMLNVGVIKGGVASNIVAENCEFRFDIRHLPSTSPASIVRELERFAADELLPQDALSIGTGSCDHLRVPRARPGAGHARDRTARQLGRAPSGDDRTARAGRVRHGSGTVRCGRYTRRNLRTGQHRAGPQTGRIRHTGTVSPL